MSLINQVLKDVEKRRVPSRSTQQKDLSGLFSVSQDRNYIWWIIAGIFILSLVAIAIWWYFQKPQKKLHVSHQHKILASKVQAKPIIVPKPKVVKQNILKPKSFMQRVAVKKTPREVAGSQYRAAIAALNQGDIIQAKGMLKIILKHDPDYQLAREQLVSLLIKQKHLKQAQNWLSKGLSVSPNYVPFVELNARILLAKGQIKSALDSLKTVSPSMSDDPGYFAILADTQRQAGNPAAAIKIYESLLQHDSTNSYWWMGLGISLEQTGNVNLAKDAYERAIVTGNLSFSLANFVETRVHKLGSQTS